MQSTPPLRESIYKLINGLSYKGRRKHFKFLAKDPYVASPLSSQTDRSPTKPLRLTMIPAGAAAPAGVTEGPHSMISSIRRWGLSLFRASSTALR